MNDEMKKEILDKVKEWEKEGYDVSFLKVVLDTDVERAKREYIELETLISRAKMLEDEINELIELGVDEDLEKYKEEIKKLSDLDDIENEILKIRIRIERERRRREKAAREVKDKKEMIMRELQEYKKEGYNTEFVEKHFDKPVEDIISIFEEFKGRVERLKTLRREIKDMEIPEGSGLEGEQKKLLDMLYDVENIVSVEDRLIELYLLIEKWKRRERTLKEREKRKREELMSRLKEWKDEGYVMESLEKQIDMGIDTDELEEAIEECGMKIEKLKTIRTELEGMDYEDYKSEIEGLIERSYHVDDIESLEEDFENLQIRIEKRKRAEELIRKEREEKIKEISEKIREWEEEGYDTSEIKAYLDKPLNELKKNFMIFRIKIMKLKEYEEKLKSMDTEGFEDKVEKIKKLLKQPSRMGKIERMLFELNRDIEKRRKELMKIKEMERKEKKEMISKLMEWINAGYRNGVIEHLESILSADLETIRTEFKRFEERIERMMALREEMDSMDIEGFEDEVEIIKSKMMDINKLDEVEKDFEELKRKIEEKKEEERRRRMEEERMRAEYRSYIDDWKSEGFNVSELEKIMEGPIDDLRKEMAIYKIRIQKAKEMIEEIREIAGTDFAEDAERLVDMIRDLRNIPLVESEMEKLKEKVERKKIEMRKRLELKRKMDMWRSMGYDVSRLEAVWETDIENVLKEFMVFRLKVQKLKEMEEEIEEMDTRGFEKDVIEIKRLLRDIDNIAEIRNRIVALQQKINRRKAEEREKLEEMKRERDEITSTICKYISEGYYMRGMDELVVSDMDTLRDGYNNLKKLVEKSENLREKAEMLLNTPFKEEAEIIIKRLKNLDLIENCERDLDDLTVRVNEWRDEMEEMRKRDEADRKDYLRMIETWEEEGFNVSMIKQIMNKPIADIRMEMILYRLRMRRLKELLHDLDEMSGEEFTSYFAEEIDDIRRMIYNLEDAEEIEARIYTLQDRINEKKEEVMKKKEEELKMREGIINQILSFMNDGYNVEYLEDMVDADISELVKEFEKVRHRIERLEEMKKKFEEIDLERYGIDEVFLTLKLKDINAVDELERVLSEISGKKAEEAEAFAEEEIREERVEAEEMAEEEVSGESMSPYEVKMHDIMEEMAGWDEKGIEIDELLDELESVDDVDAFMEELRDKVDTLLSLREKLAEMKKEGMDVNDIISLCNNIKNIDLIEEKIAHLKAERKRIKEKKKAPPKAAKKKVKVVKKKVKLKKKKRT